MFWYTCSISIGVCWISCAAPRTCTSRSSTVSTGVCYTRDFLWPHRKNRVALNPAIVEAMQWGRLGLFISAQNISYGDHEPHLQNGVVRHHVETRGVDGCPRALHPIIRQILLAGRQDKCDPLGGVGKGKARSNDRPQYLPIHQCRNVAGIHFTYVTAHSPTFPSLHLRHSSIYNPSVALPMSQLILQPFRCFTYVTAHSPTLLSLPLCHRFFTYVIWRAAHVHYISRTEHSLISCHCTMSRETKKRRFITLTGIVSTQTNQTVFLDCTVLIHYISGFSTVTTKLASHTLYLQLMFGTLLRHRDTKKS